jgi:hypothetical protein
MKVWERWLWGPEKDRTASIAEEVEFAFRLQKKLPKGLTSESILEQIEMLQKSVQKIKRSGVNMWNYKEVLPKIFDIIDGAFVVLTEIAKKQGEMEKGEK